MKKFNLIMLQYLSSGKLYKKPVFLFLLSLIIVFLVYLISYFDFMKGIENKLTDQYFKLLPAEAKADTNIVLITIDDGSLYYFEQNRISWPWPRSYYAHLVDYLKNARAVIFDLHFYEPDINREETTGFQTDSSFANAMKRAGNVFLAAQATTDSLNKSRNIKKFAASYKKENNFDEFPGILAPVDILLENARSVGIINIKPDADGVMRRIPVRYRYREILLNQLAFDVWEKTDAKAIDNEDLFSKKEDYQICWYQYDENSTFVTYPFQAIIHSASAESQGLKPLIPSKKFSGKYVVIGATATGLNDIVTIPNQKEIPGIEIWATIISNLKNSDIIQVSNNWVNFLFSLLIAFLVVYAITHFSVRKSHILILSFCLIFIFILYLIWLQKLIMMNLLFFILSLLFSYLVIIFIGYLLEGKSKREIRRVFTRYLHPGIVEKLLENPNQIKMGGEEYTATVLFVDIADFTSYSEKNEPHQVVKNLNIYLNEMTELVLKNNGFLDKYTGDGLMAVFGVPIPRTENAAQACEFVLDHYRLCSGIIKKNSSDVEEFHLNTRIGIHTGPLIAGNIGSKNRMDYTVIGDAVNLTSRLESINKIFGTNAVISRSTYDFVKQDIKCRRLGRVRVKGKNKAIMIYELMPLENSHNKEIKEKYESALGLYENMDWRAASRIFSELEEQLSDRASGFMLDRCQQLIKQNPKEWSCIFDLEVK